jgi:hypothetical protein
MSPDKIRSIAFGPEVAVASGIAGAFIASWLATKWSRWIPLKVGTKGRVELLKKHKTTIRIAKVLAFVGGCSGLLCYYNGWMSDQDWRGLGVGFGLMSFLPLGYIVAANAMRGTEAIKECMVTYAISQKTPTGLLIALMALFLVAGLVSVVSLFFERIGT